MKVQLCLCLIFLSTVSAQINAQIGINTHDPKVTLEVKGNTILNNAEGILIPKLTASELSQKDDKYTGAQDGTLVFITSGIGNNGKTSNISSKGFYYYDHLAGKWMSISDSKLPISKVFYMPSISFDTSVTATALKRNLYLEYISQFANKEFIPNSASGGTLGLNAKSTFVKSIGAPAEIPHFYNASDLYYYITDYDNTAIEVLNIDGNGILTYNIIGSGTGYSFMNIVFVVK